MPRLSARARRRVVARQLKVNRRLEARYELALRGVVRQLHADMTAAVLARFDSSLDDTIFGVLLRYLQDVPGKVGSLFDRHAASVSKANKQALRLVGIRPSDTGLEAIIEVRR